MEDNDVASEIAEVIIEALTQVTKQAQESDKNLLALIKEVVIKVISLETRVAELELLYGPKWPEVDMKIPPKM